jgi:S-methylmethionine-dependent homocysteine/selenocysteine methylase
MGPRYRDDLPTLGGELFLTDGGLETFLVFQRGIELPAFAAFPLLEDESGREELQDYYEPFLELAVRSDLGFVLETPTWRANPRWGAEVGYDGPGLDRINREAVAFLEGLRERAGGDRPVVISGSLGPHDDGYAPGEVLGVDEAEAYHSAQVGTFSDTAADAVSAITMTYAEEAIGVARAATAAGMPAVISFTVETDGRLPSGQALGEAIEQVDADSESEVAYFMLNCAHPTHFESVLGDGAAWLARLQGLRANASRMSHAELDESTELDDGDPQDLGARYAAMYDQLPRLNVLGGCCGTDHRHVGEICSAVVGASAG